MKNNLRKNLVKGVYKCLSVWYDPCTKEKTTEQKTTHILHYPPTARLLDRRERGSIHLT